MKSQAKTFVVGDGIPQPKKKGLIPEQRRRIMEAIKKATSLGEIERLEKILSSGKIPSDFELDPSLKESQNGEKEGESEKDSKDTKSTEKVDRESENKEKSTKNKDDTGDDDALADQEGDDEEDASRREIADAQVDIEMTE